MPQQTSYALLMKDAEVVLGGLNENEADFQYLEVPRQELQVLVDRARVIAREQATYTASKQAATKELTEIAIAARALITLLRVAIRQHYGKDSEKLVEFRIQPFRSRTRKPAAPSEPVEPPLPPGTE